MISYKMYHMLMDLVPVLSQKVSRGGKYFSLIDNQKWKSAIFIFVLALWYWGKIYLNLERLVCMLWNCSYNWGFALFEQPDMPYRSRYTSSYLEIYPKVTIKSMMIEMIKTLLRNGFFFFLGGEAFAFALFFEQPGWHVHYQSYAYCILKYIWRLLIHLWW